jgi:NAD(P)-dependent dehydrogenase (short-subunit alcohol dehydrogenase family)
MPGDPFSLAGKTILVTGASSGIGRQVAVSCAAHGATLVISGRDIARLDAVLAALPGPGHRAYAADLTDLEKIHALTDAAGPIDGMFFSAGIAVICPFRMVTPEHMRKLMQIDFEAPVLLTQRLLRQRQIRDGGSIVFNTSAAAHISPVGSAIYSAAKAAVNAAARTLALEVARMRVRVNCLQLGYVQTSLLGELGKSGMNVEEMTNQAPLGVGQVEDAANAAIFLLSDASRWMSRAILTADGGMCIRVT